MVRYIINPEYVLNKTEDNVVLFTTNMELIYIFNDVEQIIISEYLNATTLEDSIHRIKTKFLQSTFREDECKEYIQKLIDEKILIKC